MTNETNKPRSDEVTRSALSGQERQMIAGDFVAKNIFINQNSIVYMCLDTGFFSWDDVENLYADNDDGDKEEQEIFSWILVEPHIANRLHAQGQPVLDNDYGTWWGRTCFGQSYSSDSVIEDIALALAYA